MTRFRLTNEWLAGLSVIAIGTFAVVTALGYRLGDAANMGPGYFPVLLGVLCILFGIGIIVVDSRGGGSAIARPAYRPLVAIMAAIVAFAILIRPFGLAPAAFAAAFVSTLAEKAPLWRSVALSVGLTALAIAIFKFGLNVQSPVLTW